MKDEQQFARLLALMGKLMGSKGLTVSELGGHDASEKRKIQRDLETLRRAELPLEKSEWPGQKPRYSMKPQRIAGSLLNYEETLALTLSLQLCEGTELGEQAQRGWEKLHYVVQNGEEREVRADLPSRISVQPGWALSKVLFRDVSKALLDSRRLRLLYQGSADTEARWRLLDAWQLFFQDRWYLRGRDPVANSCRVFRLDRVKKHELTKETYLLPDSQRGTDPHFHKWDLTETEPVRIVCQVSESFGRWLTENPRHPSQTVQGDRWELEVRDVSAFLRWAAGLIGCKILEPAEVRERLREQLQARLAELA